MTMYVYVCGGVSAEDERRDLCREADVQEEREGVWNASSIDQREISQVTPD